MSSADRHSILTEIKVLSMLHHPNVIEYYENFLQDKSMIIVMEFAAGGTLFDLLETRRKEARHLEEAELAHLFAQGGTNIEHYSDSVDISTPSTCHIVESKYAIENFGRVNCLKSSAPPISTVMGSNYFWLDKLQVLFYSLVLMPSLSNDVHCPLPLSTA